MLVRIDHLAFILVLLVFPSACVLAQPPPKRVTFADRNVSSDFGPEAPNIRDPAPPSTQGYVISSLPPSEIQHHAHTFLEGSSKVTLFQ
jgi:hypothetical protein